MLEAGCASNTYKQSVSAISISGLLAGALVRYTPCRVACNNLSGLVYIAGCCQLQQLRAVRVAHAGMRVAHWQSTTESSTHCYYAGNKRKMHKQLAATLRTDRKVIMILHCLLQTRKTERGWRVSMPLLR